VSRRDRSAGKNTIGELSDPALISTLTDWLEASGARELEILTEAGEALKIVLGSGARSAHAHETAPKVRPTLPEGRSVKAPMAGLFRSAHPGSADASPLAEKGRAVEAGAIIGFIEVGPVLLPVTAPEASVVAEVHAHAGDLIGYGDAVFATEPCR